MRAYESVSLLPYHSEMMSNDKPFKVFGVFLMTYTFNPISRRVIGSGLTIVKQKSDS